MNRPQFEMNLIVPWVAIPIGIMIVVIAVDAGYGMYVVGAVLAIVAVAAIAVLVLRLLGYYVKLDARDDDGWS